ncbi:MAG: alanine--tRNA ligase-related protein, partial [bacterium]|nr:alanine--tRNA ligase-related protein [bacterium]
MTNWTAQKLRAKYLEFFQNKGHAVIPSASLIPENDPTALFISAGMHPLVPFLKGEAHPAGKRLVDFQRCLRTSDIDEVGDDSHLTFFEMLGNWSLGDYFKEKAIAWSWEFLTGKEWLALDPERIYVTCFAGDEHASRDEESAAIWKSLGVPEKHIAFLGREDNWWGPAGEVGPCGPDTEMFYKVSDGGDQRPDGVTWPPGSYFEIWNDVFMEYEKLADGGFAPLSQKNVDTGMGLERALVVLQKVNNIYETELFQELMDRVAKESKEYQAISARIVADHARASVFITADGVIPSNKEQGYVLRKLIRKTVREFRKLGLDDTMLEQLLRLIIHQYQEVYP